MSDGDVREDPPPTRSHRGVSDWLGIVSVIVAPTTIITALCFYFGYATTRSQFAYLGIDSDVLGYSTSDYILKSVSVLYAPMVALVLVWAAALSACLFVRYLLRQGRFRQQLHWFAWALIGLGAVALMRGVLGVLWPAVGTRAGGPVWTPIALIIGTGLGTLGAWIRTGLRGSQARVASTTERVSWGLAIALVVLGLFWATTEFANSYGTRQGQQTVAKLWAKETTVTLYTSYPLDAPEQLIAQDTVNGSTPLIYRHRCLRGVAVKGDRWALVPARWTPEFGYSVIADVGDQARVSITRFKGIGDRPAANWNGSWKCPELGPLQ